MSALPTLHDLLVFAAGLVLGPMAYAALLSGLDWLVTHTMGENDDDM
jgi:hypothetical protein